MQRIEFEDSAGAGGPASLAAPAVPLQDGAQAPKEPQLHAGRVGQAQQVHGEPPHGYK